MWMRMDEGIPKHDLFGTGPMIAYLPTLGWFPTRGAAHHDGQHPKAVQPFTPPKPSSSCL